MKQVDIYKKALKVMEGAVLVRNDLGITYWEYNGAKFSGLCYLIWVIILEVGITEAVEMELRFIEDSEKVLGNKLNDSKYWFTDIEEDEPRARQERIDHLEKLIKLYEDETS